MQTEFDVIDCCGLTGIYNMSTYYREQFEIGTGRYLGRKLETEEDWKHRFLNCFSSDADEEDEDVIDMGFATIMTLTEHQIREFTPTMRETVNSVGFKPVGKWVNPNTGNTVVLFVRGVEPLKEGEW